MAYGNYPSDVLPAPRADSYAFTVEPVCRRVKMDSGRYRQVQANTRQFHLIDVTWRLTDQQLQLWKGFYNVVANQGSDFFSIKLAFGGGGNTTLAQFVGDYSVQHTGRFSWDVGAQLRCETITEIDNQTDLETAGAPIGLVGTDWLTALPNVQTGYSFVVESATARTSGSSSRYFQRKRNERNVHMVNVTWKLTDAEMEFFKGWHRVILSSGTVPFEMDLAFGDGYKANTARFVEGVFTARHEGYLNWVVSAQLECDAVVEDVTYAAYLSELAERQALISLRAAGSMGIEGTGTGVIDLNKSLLSSQDFLAKGGHAVPLRHSIISSQNFTVNGSQVVALGNSTLATVP